MYREPSIKIRIDMKYIDAELLRKEIETLKDEYTDIAIDSQRRWVNANFVIDDLERLQSQIDSLQQEQPNDIRTEIEEYYGEDLALEDERTKAAYHFFSAGKAFELREYEEEREKHITDLLDNFQKGMNAGYEKAISELKEGKVECSPVMKELIDKLFGIGNTFNFGFGPKNIQQEQLPGIEEHGIPGKDFIPVEWVDACEKYGKWKIVQQEQPEVDFKIEERKWVHDAVDNIFPEDGDFMSEVDFRKILKGTARHFFNLGLNARKEE